MTPGVQALLVERDLALSVSTRTLREPGADEAVVRVEWAGVCGSDLHVLRTGDWVLEWPATPGHELYGRVVQAPENGGLAVGTAVVADSRVPCGACEACADDPDHCPHLTFVGEACPGGFATHCVLPAAGLHVVDDEVPGSTAVLAEPLAVALHALSHLRRAPGRLAVLGHGPIGSLVHAEVLRRWPDCCVSVAEPSALRRGLADAFGATTVAGSGELSPMSFDVVVDAAGYAGSLKDALSLCALGSDVLLVALAQHEVTVSPAALVERRIRITGCHAFVDELPEAVRLLSSDGWRYDPVVTDVVELAELPAALARLLASPADAVKLLVRP